jgi:hypothetical protein
MNSLEAILKSAEQTAQAVADPELRKIAFQEIVKHALAGQEAPPTPAQRPAAARQQKPRSLAGKGKAAGTPVIRPDIASLELSPDEKGLAPWGTLSTDWKKFCWILEAARKKGVDGLSNSEISHLVDKTFRESKTPEVVNNLKVQIKRGMVRSVVIKSADREYRVWRILAGGIKEVTGKPEASE